MGPHGFAHALSFDRAALRVSWEVTAVATILGWAAIPACAIGCAASVRGPIAPSSVPAAPVVASASVIPPSPVASSALEPPVVSAASPAGPAPTWAELFAAYMAPGTEGGCGRTGRCHARQMGDAASAYEWLKQRGYIAGTGSAIASRANSCLRWFGGNMPPGGHANPKAAADVAAWVAVGAPED